MKVLNFGSLNIDYTYRLRNIVKPGETMTSAKLEIFPGGKGLNQSIALARAGVQVYHAGLIGSDGSFLLKTCKESGVDVSLVRECKERTGNAIIQVSEEGQNSIILFPGANRQVTEEYINMVLKNFGKGDILLLQNEINRVDMLIDKAKEKRMKVVLNPSPYDENMENCDLGKVDLFFLNEIEGEQITGKTDFQEILAVMREKYPQAGVVLTVGAQGAYYSDADGYMGQEAYQAEIVDTTAAGDTFVGFFLKAIIEGQNKKTALLWGTMAASLAISKKGAAVSIPSEEEVKQVFHCL